jgi:hypothetical protein
MEEARIQLSDKLKQRGEEVGIISKEMLIEESVRMVMVRLEENRRYHQQLQCMKAFRDYLIEAKENERESIKHYKRCILRKCFIPWTEWCYLNSIGLDKARWKGPRKLIVSYNQTAVDAFSDRRVKKLFFNLWRPVTKRYGDGKRMRRRNFSKFLVRHIAAWQVVARQQRTLIKWSIDEWKSYSVRLTEVPFRMWFVWMDQRKRKKADQQRLITAYIRTKHRKFLWNILRGWRHQAVYGRIAGLYSRNDLMKSLTEQKQQCKVMENEMNLYIGSVNEMNLMLENNTKKVKDMESKLKVKDEKNKELRLAMHHCEQEMVRMQSLVDSVQQAAPGVSKHIIELQGGQFNFSTRGLDSLVKLRKKEEEESGKATELSKTDLAEEEDDGGLLFGADGDEGGGDAEKKTVVAQAAPVDDGAIDADSQRMNWVLSRVDYRDVNVQQLAGVADDDEEEQKDPKDEVLELRQQLVNMYGLFEFLRNGDVNVLSAKEKELYEAEKIVGGTLQEKPVVQPPAEGVAVEGGAEEEGVLEGEEEGLNGDTVEGDNDEPQTNTPTYLQRRKTKKMQQMPAGEVGPIEPVNKKWKKITNPATVTGQPYQWKDFVLSLNRKLPKNRKTETTQDKLMTRMQIGKERRDNIVRANTQTMQRGPISLPADDLDANLYTGKDFEDDTKPVTPRGFGMD